jgi:hypothetical protein
MALFGFSDITFSKGVSERTGPLDALVGNEFKTTTLRYPLDVGNADKAHYIVIYIRRQKASTAVSKELELKGGNAAFEKSRESLQAGAEQQIRGALSSATSSVQNVSKNFGSEILGKINSGLNQINTSTNGALSGITSAISGAAGGAVSGLNNLFGKTSVSMTGSQAETTAFIDTSIKKITGGSTGLLRTTRLTTDAIALYMPDTLQYDYQQGFDTPSIGGEMLGQIATAGKSLAEQADKDGGSAATREAAGAILTKLGQKTAQVAGELVGGKGAKSGGLGFTAVTGKVSNPMLELVYTAPQFREFNFEFTFYPRDEREALEAQRIIERLRFHQAPELADASLYLIPPSEFDIKFYYAGAENPNIPPIAEGCVLQSMQVNYAPNGFSAYEVPGENKPALGRTGMPVAIQLTLSFKETTFFTKADFRDDSNVKTLAKV